MALLDRKITVKNELLTCLFILIGTFLFCVMINYLFSLLKGYGEEINWYYGFGFGCSAGILFMISFTIAGGLSNSFSIMLARWVDFFQNIRISFGFALRSFFLHIKDEGMCFWAYMLVIAIQLAGAYYGISNLVEVYL